MVFRSNMDTLSNKLISLSRAGKTTLMVATDALALPFCFAAAMWLRLGDTQLMLEFGYLPYLYVPIVTLVVFAISGLYRAVIRFIDRHLLTRTIVSLGVVVAISYSLTFFLGASDLRLPRNALMIYWLIAFAYILFSRLSVRSFLRRNVGGTGHAKTSVAIYGAGEAGVQLLRAMRSESKYEAVCFFDDKEALVNRTVAGLKVFSTAHLNDLVNQMAISQIVLAIPSVSPQRRGEILRSVNKVGIPIKTLSSLMELTDGNITTRSIREVKIEDLLGRSPVPPMLDLFSKCIRSQNVLVTGAGGSIGSELCRQIMTQAPSCLHLLDHSEYALYTIEQELRTRFPKLSIHAHLGSACDDRLVNRIIDDGEIDTIYHAAAYKHVPLVEANMAEGIRNNVLGAQIIVSAAARYQVKTCVLISTDKAVRPTNIMGASKRIAEQVFQAAASKSAGKTTFCMVRFGNVLGSSGSVIPLFRQQIENGGPVTITHPDIIRYFMLTQEAAQLVIQAGAMAKGGDVFVLDMGEPVKIIDLARTMIELSGLTEKADDPQGDIEIKFIGLRPGEKLFEELLIGGNATPSDHPRIMVTSDHCLAPEVLNQLVGKLMIACHNNQSASIKVALQEIVREYTPSEDFSLIADAHLITTPTPSTGNGKLVKNA